MNLDPVVVNYEARHPWMFKCADQGLSKTGDGDVGGGPQEQPQHHPGHQGGGQPPQEDAGCSGCYCLHCGPPSLTVNLCAQTTHKATPATMISDCQM